MRINITKFVSTALLLGAGLMVVGFKASAATISMVPSEQVVADGASFSIDIMATGLPSGTAGGGFDVLWDAADMTLDSVFLATLDPADSGGGQFPGNWDSISSFFSGTGTIGAGSLTDLFVGSWDGLEGDQAIARLNFTLSSGVSNSVISFDIGPEDAWGEDTPPFDFTADITFTGAVINPIPVPAAVWLFGTGLLGLVGVARRRA